MEEEIRNEWMDGEREEEEKEEEEGEKKSHPSKFLRPLGPASHPIFVLPLRTSSSLRKGAQSHELTIVLLLLHEVSSPSLPFLSSDSHEIFS